MAEEEFGGWDAEDFDPDAGFAQGGGDDRWAGEDEGLDLTTVAEQTKPEKPVKSKKTKEERIAEKKAKHRAEQAAMADTEEGKPLSLEEQMAEKLRLQQVQKDADLEVAKELFGVTRSEVTIDSMQPGSLEDFQKFEEALANKISEFQTSPHFVGFLDQLITRTCAGLDVEDLRRLSKTLSTMATEKQKAKAPKAKKKAKATLGVGKASKRAVDLADLDNDLGAEFDDFM